MSFIKVATLVGAIATTVSAHGRMENVIVDGKATGLYNAGFHYGAPAGAPANYIPPGNPGWGITEWSNGFVKQAMGDDVICHAGAASGTGYVDVQPGSKINMLWTGIWPESHHGPVINYLAKCPGECSTADKTQLKFFKFDAQGYIDENAAGGQGNWASDVLIKNNNSWTSTMPSDLAPGNYVLRHEIIALHDSPPQLYPQCFNIKLGGSGTKNPEGVVGTELYPGDISYAPWGGDASYRAAYKIPGPAPYNGAGGSSPAPAPAPSSSAPAPSSSAAPAPSSSKPAPAPTSAEYPTSTPPAAPAPTTLTTSTRPAVPTGGSGSGSGPAVPLPQGADKASLVQWFTDLINDYYS